MHRRTHNKADPKAPIVSTPGLAFDAAAARYDSDAARNPVMIWLRRESLRTLLSVFKPGDRVLEIGCGTGEEAVALARRGIVVLCTDASGEMVRVAREKAAAAGLGQGLLTARILPAEGLGSLAADGVPLFDGAYSSLGALNCVAHLAPVADDIARLITPGGKVVLSLLNKYCLWETAWYLGARKPALALRRWGGRSAGTAIPGGPLIRVYFWPVLELRRTFERHFDIVAIKSLPWALPPTYAAGPVARHPRLLRVLGAFERRTARLWPLYAVGDHVLLVMSSRRRPVALADPKETE